MATKITYTQQGDYLLPDLKLPEQPKVEIGIWGRRRLRYLKNHHPMVADIGNGTMNTLYLVNGKPQSGKMFTEKFGTYQCTLAIREGFMRKTRRELNDYIIDEVLQTGTADIPDSDLEIITAIAEEYVAEIFRRLREHGYDESTMKLCVCGGGGCLIKNFYHGKLDRVKFIDDICAAAKGYGKLLNEAFKPSKCHEGDIIEFSLFKTEDGKLVCVSDGTKRQLEPANENELILNSNKK